MIISTDPLHRPPLAAHSGRCARSGGDTIIRVSQVELRYAHIAPVGLAVGLADQRARIASAIASTDGGGLEWPSA